MITNVKCVSRCDNELSLRKRVKHYDGDVEIFDFLRS